MFEVYADKYNAIQW